MQVDSLKKGYDGFDKDGGTINQTSMMMILKSMGVEVNKSDMDNYAAEVDEEETGKFTFMMFCQVHFRNQANFKMTTNIHIEGGRQVHD